IMADTGGIELDNYNFESNYVHLPEGRIHYVEAGSGPTLLMIHGNPTWSYLYRHMIHGLKDRFHCVAVDHLGFGLSDKPAGADYSVLAHSRRLGEVVEALGLEKVTPVVQDWGGPIGLHWTVQNKDLIERLVILNTIGFIPRLRDLSLSRIWALPLLGFLKAPGLGELFLQRLNAFVLYGVPGAIHNAESKTRERMKGYRHPFPDYASRAAMLELPREIPLSPWHPNIRLFREIGAGLKDWDVRTQLIWGLRDPAFNIALARRFEQLLPNHAPTIEIPNASHFLQEDTPEPIIEAIRGFFEAA
ncbi:MAG: alpha/beta fold hydrolase, partial [Chrysiogenetes bacterium]|nr:alpha/beta fold hydrolase [Chrysiogenetes bacterium]